jgi:hypothetical protein
MMMPSPPGYKRDIKQETKTAKARGEIGGHDAPHAIRMRARRLAVKKGMVKPNDGKDVDHKQPLSKGGAGTDLSNLRVESDNANRSFPRNPDGSLKANHPKSKKG